MDKDEIKKLDEDDLLVAWERFLLKAHNRQHFDLREMGMVFETWIKIKWGKLLERSFLLSLGEIENEQIKIYKSREM